MAETIKTILEADTGNFHTEFSKARGAIEEYHKRILQIGAAIGGSALLSAAVGKFNEIRNSIDQLNDQSARLEMPVEEMQRLNAVATMSGASVETLAKALNKSKLNAADAAGGSESLANAFADLGINAKEFVNLDPTERLVALSRGFNGATNQGAAFSAIFKVMGKSAGELIPMLRDGEAGIAAISARLAVIGGADVAAVAKMNDEIDLLANNIKTQVAGAFIALRPQIESFIGLLSKAADGMAVALDPAGGIGRQGGDLGGADMLREMDTLSARIEQIKSKQKSGDVWSWTQGPAALSLELKNSVAAVDALKTRFAGLSAESQVYAGQLREFERLRDSGMGKTEFAAEVKAMQDRSTEAIRVLAAEKELAQASAATAAEMQKQQEEMAKMVASMEALKSKVSGRIIALQSPEKRQEVAKEGLRGILAREGAGNVDELRRRVGTSTNDTDKMKALQALDEALDRLEEIKRATAETQNRTTTNFQAWNDAIKRAAAATRQAMEDGQKLQDQATAKNAEDASRAAAHHAAKTDYQAEIIALQLQVSGRKALADKFREETAFRKEAADIAAAQGISEAEALTTARERGRLIKEIAEQEEKAAIRAQRHPGWKPRSEYRGIRGVDSEDGFSAGNNLKDWMPEWRMGRPTNGNGHPIQNAAASLKADALRKRAEERDRAGNRNSADPNTRLLQELSDTTKGLTEGLKKLGVL